MLALDPPGDPTIGACLAGDLSGPRRHRYGAMRDLVIGVTVVLADGHDRELGRQGREERRRLRPRQALLRLARPARADRACRCGCTRGRPRRRPSSPRPTNPRRSGEAKRAACAARRSCRARSTAAARAAGAAVRGRRGRGRGPGRGGARARGGSGVRATSVMGRGCVRAAGPRARVAIARASRSPRVRWPSASAPLSPRR